MRLPMFARLVAIASVVGLSLLPLPSLPANAAGGLATDKVVSTHQSTPSATVVSPAFTTSQTGELLLAFVTTDGPAAAGSQQFSSVTGSGLTWRLRQRTNIRYGTAEVWQAAASGILTNATVTATHTGSYQASITVATFTGADTATDGAVLGANGATGAPTATLTTTRTGSWVWAVGNDWSRAAARTVGTGQTKVDEFLASNGDTFWTQRQTAPATATAPSSVTINDTAPTNDMWNMSMIEILPSGAPDAAPPTAPTGLTATATSPTNVNLSWTASTDNVGVTGYQVFRAASQIGTSVTTSYSDNTTTGSTTYDYTVKAVDAAGNLSAASASAPASVTTPAPAPDTTPPTVSLTSPANGSTVSGTTAVTANASDNQGVVGVQFKLDGANLSAESTASPCSVQWDTTTVAGGSHTHSAVARDAAGNTATASPVTVTVSNSGSDPAVVGSWGPVQAGPEVSIHAALTNTGKVLTWEGDFTQGGQQYLLDPVTGSYIQVPNAAADLFCAGQAVLPDGRVLVIGGISMMLSTVPCCTLHSIRRAGFR